MRARSPWWGREGPRESWLALGRLGTGVLLAGLALFGGGTFRSDVAMMGAAAAALVLAIFTWFRPGGRVQAAGTLALDIGWVSVAVLASGRLDAGLTLLYPLVAFGAGLCLGGWPLLAISLASGGALLVSSWSLGGFASAPTQIVVQGALVGVLGMVSDRMRSSLHARERALQYASKALERMRLDTDTIVRDLGSGLISVDAGGMVIHCNRAAEETLGLGAETVRGRPARQSLAGGHASLLDALEAGLSGGVPVQRMELQITRGEVSVPLGVGTTILRGREGEVTGVAALFQDLTDIRRQESIEKRRERMAAVGELAAGIAHEIRNSILPVSGSVQLLAQEIKPVGEQAKLFALIERETDNIERFVSSLLSYTRERRLHRTSFDLIRMLHEVAGDVKLGRSDVPRIEIPAAERLRVWADPEQLRQVLRNLMANAADAAGSGGEVRVTLGEDTGGMWIEVADDGPGIPHKEREQVFQPFYTTKAGGTGLGLSIASRIVEDHGGELRLADGAGKGTVFRVELPRGDSTEDGWAVPEAA